MLEPLFYPLCQQTQLVGILIIKKMCCDHIPVACLLGEIPGSCYFSDHAQESFVRVLVGLALNHTMFFSLNP